MADDTESYFISLAVQRGMATPEAARECVDLARTPRAGGRSVLHLLCERARIPTEVARNLHQEAVAMATQARTRGGDLNRWISGSSSSIGPAATGTTSNLGRVPPPAATGAPAASVPAPTWPGQPDPTAAGGSLGGAASSSFSGATGFARPRQFSAGDTFSRYRLESELGRGGMGVVWKARQLDLDRPVAVKMLITGTSADDRRRARFMAEAKAVAKLVHPNIVAIHEVGEVEGVLFFSMDLVEGPSLAEALKAGPFEVKRALDVARGIADGLSCAHAQKIVHRDLKPANILIDPRGNPRITDFGIAKDLTIAQGQGQTITGEVLGTPAYMPPEQADGRTHDVDERADVYSLGAILHRMIAGRSPFDGQTPYDVITKVLSEPATPLRKLDKRVPADVEAIALRCLEKEREARYGSADEVLGAIIEAQGRLEQEGRGEPLPRRGGGFPVPVAAAALVVALLGVGVGIAGYLHGKQQDAQLEAQRLREEAAKAAALEQQLLREAAEKRGRAIQLAGQALEREATAPQEALGLARDAVELSPDAADAQAALARLLLSVANDPQGACGAADRAIAADAACLAARVTRGRCLLRLDRPAEELEAEAAQLERLGPHGRAAAAELRAELALRKNELAVAIVHLDEAVHQDEKDARLRLRLAQLLLRARRFSAADEEATATLRLDRSAEALLARARARAELGRVADALQDAEEAARIDPRDAGASALLTELRGRQPTRQPSGHAPTGQAGDPHDAVHAALRAFRQARERGDGREAMRQLQASLETLDVSCAGALEERVTALLEAGRFQDANADLERLQKLEGETVELRLLGAKLLLRLERPDEAFRSLARAAELDPKDYRPHELGAQLREQRHEYDLAAAEWERVLTKAPEGERSWLVHERAHFRHRRGQLDEALADMDESIATITDKGHLFLARGEMHADAGHSEQAVADLREALRLGNISRSEETRARTRLQELER